MTTTVQSVGPWSRIPPEIAHEIAGHNADDVPTLCAMSLVSKSTRSLAIIHLFSFIHFSCAEDFPRWLDMLGRTPTLGTIVRRVKFTEPDEYWLRHRRGLSSATPLIKSAVQPIIPVFPNAEFVEWHAFHRQTTLAMATAHMALFPNVTTVHLKDTSYHDSAHLINFLGACGGLKTLCLSCVIQGESGSDSEESELASHHINDKPTPLDLTGLENLTVIECGDEERDCVACLIAASPPSGLKSLTFGDPDEPCSLHSMESLLRLGTQSLVELTIPTALETDDDQGLMEMFSRLPVFPLLNTLTIWLGPDPQDKHILNALQGAPNLTTLIFRILLDDDEDYVSEDFDTILGEALWSSPESMKAVLTRKFPLCRRFAVHFCVLGDSHLHFQPGLRGKMERRLTDRLEEIGVGMSEYLEVEWLDNEFNPVTYNKTDGKPPWKANDREFDDEEWDGFRRPNVVLPTSDAQRLVEFIQNAQGEVPDNIIQIATDLQNQN
ncbi:hypothetical protein DFH07DRAFT_331805 [Mycena maculata]|uniref:Uncharacterized protein n=1 Tax=Mycena maculata TaxID=230809 RepID=A0AAD7MIU2_9AGAR|nr:hypothetical protein DFH07DRAFT_331805 [Mycena maculata]